MAKNDTEFSKYAQAFHEVIDCNKTDIDFFTKDLLKMGLTDNDKELIDEMYPTTINKKGELSIADNKGGTLRKYYNGERYIRRLISKLETEFDPKVDTKFKQRYSEELQDYEESRIIEFAKKLELDIKEDDINKVSEAIADHYSSTVINEAATKKGRTSKKSKDNPKSEEQNIAFSYTITDEEKKIVYNICTAIQANLRQLQSQFKYICSKQHELGELTDSELDKRRKPYLEGFIESKTNEFNETYSDLVSQCLELNTILAPKEKMNKSFAKLISITSFFSSDEYKEMSIDRFADAHVQVKVYDLRTYIEYSLKEIDMQ